MFITKSPPSLIRPLEYLEGRMEIVKRGGFEQATPHHAIVIIFALSEFPQLTSTTGTGYKASPGDNSSFDILKVYYLVSVPAGLSAASSPAFFTVVLKHL
jgi:hypothetical protein